MCAEEVGIAGVLVGDGHRYDHIRPAGDARRHADRLAAAMTRVNADCRLVRHSPGANVVRSWINEARSLPRAVEHWLLLLRDRMAARASTSCASASPATRVTRSQKSRQSRDLGWRKS